MSNQLTRDEQIRIAALNAAKELSLKHDGSYTDTYICLTANTFENYIKTGEVE